VSKVSVPSPLVMLKLPVTVLELPLKVTEIVAAALVDGDVVKVHGAAAAERHRVVCLGPR